MRKTWGALAFTDGIGEHNALLHARVLQRLAHLGVALGDATNAQATGTEVRSIHTHRSAVEVWVVLTDEGKVAAQPAADVLWPANTAGAS